MEMIIMAMLTLFGVKAVETMTALYLNNATVGFVAATVVFVPAYVYYVITAIAEDVTIDELDDIVVPGSLGEACCVGEAIDVLDRIDSLQKQVFLDIDAVKANNSDNDFRFFADTLKIKYTFNEECRNLTLFTSFRDYAVAKEDEVQAYIDSIREELKANANKLEETITERTKSFLASLSINDDHKSLRYRCMDFKNEIFDMTDCYNILRQSSILLDEFMDALN